MQHRMDPFESTYPLLFIQLEFRTTLCPCYLQSDRDLLVEKLTYHLHIPVLVFMEYPAVHTHSLSIMAPVFAVVVLFAHTTQLELSGRALYLPSAQGSQPEPAGSFPVPQYSVKLSSVGGGPMLPSRNISVDRMEALRTVT